MTTNYTTLLYQPSQFSPKRTPKLPNGLRKPYVEGGDLVDYNDKLVAASVLVSSQKGSGSGTCIAVNEETKKAYILTARHVIPLQDGKITVTFPSRYYQIPLTAKVVDKSPGTDLALLEIPWRVGMTYVSPLFEGDVKGDGIYQVGYPGGVGPKKRSGFIRGHENAPGFPQGSTALVLSVQPGDSGSGVFADGKLVGVLWGKNKVVATSSSMIGTSTVQAYCRRLRILIGPRRPLIPIVPVVPRDRTNPPNIAQGPPGPAGPSGKDGLDGKPGLAGRDGINGKDGANGKDGKDGLTPDLNPLLKAIADQNKMILDQQAQITRMQSQFIILQTTVTKLASQAGKITTIEPVPK